MDSRMNDDTIVTFSTEEAILDENTTINSVLNVAYKHVKHPMPSEDKCSFNKT